MRTLRIAACVLPLLTLAGVAAGRPQAPGGAAQEAAAPAEPALRDELLRMMRVDQWYRRRAMEGGPDALPVTPLLHDDMRAADRANGQRLEAIVKERGWPGKSMVGADGARAAFLILQHGELALQQALLGTFERAVEAGEASASDLAYLTDRVRVRTGRKQLYGTQVSFGAAGKAQPVGGLEDAENVDARRAKVGLGPLAEYLRTVEGGASGRMVRAPAAGAAPLKVDPKDLPPGVVVAPVDGAAPAPGRKLRVVPMGEGVATPDGRVLPPPGPKTAEDPVADPALREELLTEPAMTVATPENRPASAPPGETVMIAGPDGRLDRLRAVVKERGWPGHEMVGARASAAAFHVARRAPVDAVRELVPALRAAADAGQASKAHAAFLEDLLRVREGRPQLYGTQVRRGADGGIELEPVEDPAQLDARRSAAGLPPAAEFLASLRPPRE